MVCELGGKHSESVMSAVFSRDDSRVVTVSTDKYIILWEIRLTGGPSSGAIMTHSSSCTYKAIELSRVETRCYLDLAISESRLVAKG